MKICARCDERMPDAAAMPLDKTSDSGAGMTLYIHQEPCAPLPHQASPVSRADEPIREG